MTTIDQVGRLVLDFYRCAMLPLSPGAAHTGHADDLSQIGTDLAGAPDPTVEWNAAAFRERIPGPHFYPDIAGSVLRSTGDVVSSAPELARLTLNIAATHHDSRVGGQRLVYGGHTIGLALAQAVGCCPTWRPCSAGTRAITPGPCTRATPSTASYMSSRRTRCPTPRRRGHPAVGGLRGRRGRDGPPSAGLAVHRAALLGERRQSPEGGGSAVSPPWRYSRSALHL